MQESSRSQATDDVMIHTAEINGLIFSTSPLHAQNPRPSMSGSLLLFKSLSFDNHHSTNVQRLKCEGVGVDLIRGEERPHDNPVKKTRKCLPFRRASLEMMFPCSTVYLHIYIGLPLMKNPKNREIRE